MDPRRSAISLPDEFGHVTQTRATDEPVSLVLVLTPEEAGHLALAISRHDRFCRDQGGVMPARLSTLVEVLTANGAQRGSFRADLSRPVDAVFMTYAQAAMALGCSPRTIGRMTRDGRLRAVGAGSGRRIAVAEVERFAAEGAA